MLQIRLQVLKRDNFTCTVNDSYCSKMLRVHHIVPIDDGGTNDLGNLEILCNAHHRATHKWMRHMYKKMNKL